MADSRKDRLDSASTHVPTELSELSDEDLIRRATASSNSGSELDMLFRRYHPTVARWSLRFCRDPEDAADLAQEVFLRVHPRIGTFRMECRFSTWLYKVARSIAINRASVAKRRPRPADLPAYDAGWPGWDVPDPSPNVEQLTQQKQLSGELRRAIQQDLDLVEAKVLYLHFINGLTLNGVTELLKLKNKSGAKAYVVSGKRKLKRRLARHEQGRSSQVLKAI